MSGDTQGALTETVYYTLLSLLSPLHGYGIMQRVRQMSGGRVSIGPGTLYGALAALADRGWIEPVGEGGDRKKEYLITSAGREVMEREIERLEELVENGRLASKGADRR
jgi:DNA-binding PadR family transcriptional regulator